MITIGDRVKILSPFDHAFPAAYTVTEINESDHWVRVAGEESAFDFRFVEVLDAT
jgi:hypothetical protein